MVLWNGGPQFLCENSLGRLPVQVLPENSMAAVPVAADIVKTSNIFITRQMRELHKVLTFFEIADEQYHTVQLTLPMFPPDRLTHDTSISYRAISCRSTHGSQHLIMHFVINQAIDSVDFQEMTGVDMLASRTFHVKGENSNISWTTNSSQRRAVAVVCGLWIMSRRHEEKFNETKISRKKEIQFSVLSKQFWLKTWQGWHERFDLKIHSNLSWLLLLYLPFPPLRDHCAAVELVS